MIRLSKFCALLLVGAVWPAVGAKAQVQEHYQPGFFYEVPQEKEMVANAKGEQGLPTFVQIAAMDTIGVEHGEIAHAQIGSSNLFVVYVRFEGECGSSGCRAQIWKMDDGRAVLLNSLPVGHLPIVMLPAQDSGMPRLGVTVWDKTLGHAILPIAFDGEIYSSGGRDAVPLTYAGHTLITESMLRTFSRAESLPQFPTAFRGAWAKKIDQCEHEFTGGFTINRDRITYYEGTDLLVEFDDQTKITGTSGLGNMMVAEMAYVHAGEVSFPRTVCLTMVEATLFRMDETGDSIGPGDLYFLCPTGSIGN
ncbi:hypothetical protein GRI44_07025 [Altererythrobacter confluentis]|uniref:Uncharacterized protein n=1 Tax=Allopontixanthobacter confluentis TaxID=1849021 RepID=A0A6L7GII4_9SPHN|nr:hypothetical protein [Allopontixanthobacter confluentis]MXP14501.1 hypothetical protein [Allopontixanthobacter confluentis]